MSLTYLVLRAPRTEPLPFGHYAAMACLASGNRGVGTEEILAAEFETIEQTYAPVLGRIEARSINSEAFHSDDLYVILHGYYPNADELMFDIAIGDMPQPWKTIFAMLTDWASVAGIDLHLGELTYINHDRVVMQVTGLAPVMRRAITNPKLEVAK